jgi:RNA polymerase sigma factor (sigma-70 family)
MNQGELEGLLRELAPQVLTALVRRYGQFDLCEDATQEALLAAATRWPAEGLPQNPRGWLVTVGSRRLVDEVRSEHSRRQREDSFMAEPETGQRTDHDDSLSLLFLCCHPSLSPPSQIALTLRAVGGLSTAQIAAAFLVPEATMAQRISRAKQSIRDAGARFAMPARGELDARTRTVLQVLYLVFNEGYTTTDGPELTAPRLSGEAIRLARWLHRLLPADPEVTGLLALMLLTDARRAARTAPDGSVIPLAEQDRSRWDGSLIAEGAALVTSALQTGPVGPYQLQAAIAAVHDEASDVDTTDWPQILGLYDVLQRLAPNPMVSLNRAVAVARVHGPVAALQLVETLAADGRLKGHHRLHSTRAHLLELLGDEAGAAESYREAARRATSLPERRNLSARAAMLSGR